MRPGLFRGAVNFNGGWLGRACPEYETLSPALFARGALAGIPTLWLHGSHVQYDRIGHCLGNFEQFLRAGGQGPLLAAPAGHALMFKPALWAGHVDEHLERLS